MLQQNIQSAVNTTIHIAEERHLGVINELVDSAEQAHALRMSELARQANEVLMKQASDHALLIDIRSQDERAKAEWAQRYAAERDLAAYEGQVVLTARIQQLQLELRSKDEVAARIAMQRDCEAHELSARMRRWAANHSDHGSVNSARSGHDTPPLDAISTTAHFSVLEYNDVCGQKITSSGIPTTYANTGYEGSQSSAPHDNTYHGDLANPERAPSYSAQGYPLPGSFSSSSVDGRGAAVWSTTGGGVPYAPLLRRV